LPDSQSRRKALVTEQSFHGVPSPFDKLIGLRLEEASGERVVAVLPVTAELLQSFGVVHGGAYTAAVESTASVGAYLAMEGRVMVVGISNHTQFLRPVREGGLRVEATPLARGQSTQLWQVAISDQHGRLVAHGEVRLMHLDGPAPPLPA
jgi:1,4-dihydroxy-2-naphthoyl-CoA hydrolase